MLEVEPKSIDCGKDTWLTHGFVENGNFRGVAGRISLSDWTMYTADNPMLFVRIGAYDFKTNPAAHLFREVECNGGVARFFYDTKGDSGAEYSLEDLKRQWMDGTDPRWVARSAMVPPGYRLVLFSSDVWLG